MRLGLAVIAPVVARHVHRVGQGAGHLNQRPGITAAKFNQQHAVLTVLRQSIGHRTTGRASTYNYIVVGNMIVFFIEKLDGFMTIIPFNTDSKKKVTLIDESKFVQNLGMSKIQSIRKIALDQKNTTVEMLVNGNSLTENSENKQNHINLYSLKISVDDETTV